MQLPRSPPLLGDEWRHPHGQPWQVGGEEDEDAEVEDAMDSIGVAPVGSLPMLAVSDYSHAHRHAQAHWQRSPPPLHLGMQEAGAARPPHMHPDLRFGEPAASPPLPASYGVTFGVAPPFSASSRSQGHGALPSPSPPVHDLPLSSHAFPPTISPEQHAHLSVAVAAAQPRHGQVQQRASQYGMTSAPVPVRSSASSSARASGGRYHSPGTTPTHASSRATGAVPFVEHVGGRSMTPPLDPVLVGSTPRNTPYILTASSSSSALALSPSQQQLYLQQQQQQQQQQHATATPIPPSRRSNSRGSSSGALESMLLPIRPGLASSTASSTSTSGGGLKRKSTSQHSLLDLAPPLPLHSGGGSAGGTPPSGSTPAASGSTKKGGMGRKSQSERSLIPASERKANRLRRKAELARVSRKKKKGHLHETMARIAHLQEAIAVLEGREPPASSSAASAAASGTASGTGASSTVGSLVSPSGSFSNLVLSPSSSTSSMTSAARASSRLQASKRARRDSVDASEAAAATSARGGESEEDSEEDSEEEDSDDSAADSQEEEEDPTFSPPHSKHAGLQPSTSAPHLSRLQQFAARQQHSSNNSSAAVSALPSAVNSPALSRQHSSTPPGASGVLSRPHSLTNSATPPPMQVGGGHFTPPGSMGGGDEGDNLAAFLPRVTPCPVLDPSTHDVLALLASAGVAPPSSSAAAAAAAVPSPLSSVAGSPSCSLVQLHRFMQDSLTSIVTALQLDPFEKLLRWVALQATNPQPSDATAAAILTPQAQAQASAFAFLSQQLDLSPAQLSALRQTRVGIEGVAGDIGSMRQDLVRTASAVRGYVAALDAMQGQLQPVGLQAGQLERLAQWVQGNAQWIHTQQQQQQQSSHHPSQQHLRQQHQPYPPQQRVHVHPHQPPQSHAASVAHSWKQTDSPHIPPPPHRAVPLSRSVPAPLPPVLHSSLPSEHSPLHYPMRPGDDDLAVGVLRDEGVSLPVLIPAVSDLGFIGVPSPALSAASNGSMPAMPQPLPLSARALSPLPGDIGDMSPPLGGSMGLGLPIPFQSEALLQSSGFDSSLGVSSSSFDLAPSLPLHDGAGHGRVPSPFGSLEPPMATTLVTDAELMFDEEDT